MFTLRWFLGLEFGFARRHYIIVDRWRNVH